MWARHLSREVMLAVVEGGGDVPDREHVERCDRCRRDVDALRATLATVRDVEVPEPSPLFWDHLSARISQSIADEEAPASAARTVGVPAWRSGLWLAGVATAVALAVMVTWQPADRSTLATLSVPNGEAGWAAEATAVEQGDTGWELLVNLAVVAEEESWGELVGGVQPGMADRALQALSDAERTALIGLLEIEMRQPSS